MVDPLRYIPGECSEVDARASFTDLFYEDLCTVQLVFENSSVGMLTASREAGQWREHVEAYGGGVTALPEDLDSCRILRAAGLPDLQTVCPCRDPMWERQGTHINF